MLEDVSIDQTYYWKLLHVHTLDKNLHTKHVKEIVCLLSDSEGDIIIMCQ